MIRNCLHLTKTTINLTYNEYRLNLLKRWAGHSKWQNIKHTKQAKDAAKSNAYVRMSRKINIAIQEGKSIDPEANIKLKHAIEEARRIQMPNANITNAIKAAQSNKEKAQEVLLIVRGSKNLTFLVELCTSKPQRVSDQLKSLGRKFNFHTELARGNENDFTEISIIKAKPLCEGKEGLEKALEHAIEAEAEEVNENDENELVFQCSGSTIHKVKSKLEGFGYTITSVDTHFKFLNNVELNDNEVEVCSKFLNKVQEHEDVLRVVDNIV